MVSWFPSFTTDMRILSQGKYTAYPTAERKGTKTHSAIDGEPTPKLAVTATQCVIGHSDLSAALTPSQHRCRPRYGKCISCSPIHGIIPTKSPSQAHHKKESVVSEDRKPFRLGLSLQFERRTVGVELDSTNGATSGQV
jgi:hypothetical protein